MGADGGTSVWVPDRCGFEPAGYWQSRPRRSPRARFPSGAAAGWLIAASPAPAGAHQTYLDGVSCTGSPALDCFAVGSYVTAQGSVKTLVEHSTGGAWKVVASPNRTGAVANALVAVSCTSATSCFAVGNSQASPTAAAMTLIERWNGHAWTIVASPDASHSTGNYLDGISCVNATKCFAVGDYTSGGTAGSTLIERWNGAAWAIMPSPNRSGAAVNQLSSVSCKAALTKVSCFAVGQWSSTTSGSALFTLTERFNGAAWVVVASPNFEGRYRTSLNDVSCTSATFCMAVGVWQHSPGASVSERWNGSAWTIFNVPNDAGFTFSGLNSVSCASPTDCVAVGSWATGGQPEMTLVVHWNGTAWSIVGSPNPPKAQGSSFAAVSHVGARCSAVGSYVAPLGAAPLAERNF